MRELGITQKHAEIVFASLNSKAVLEIAVCLLTEASDDNSDLIRAIKEIPRIARRNHLTHSSIHFASDGSEVAFVLRDIASGKFKYRPLSRTVQQFYDAINELHAAMVEVQTLSGVTDENFISYTHGARASLDEIKSGIPTSSIES
ncbi:MAG: hypothetical protein KDJ77_20255 [Rhodobiaceae bacterium]|nr:hypothetical protein [Rhodobiaceae bacterium]